MDLIRRSQAGDEEAFAELFRQYQDLVFKTAYLMTGNADEAKDALQEVFLQVHKALDSFQPSRGAFTTWLHRVTVNRCLSRRRKHHLPTLSLSEDFPMSASPRSLAEGDLEELDAVRQALIRLSEKLRAVVILRYYQELPYAEIAQILNIPVGTVGSRLDMALKALRKELETPTEPAPTRGALSQREVAK